jgi:phosphohistidine phosphatase
MSELYLLRHAKAVPQTDAWPDRERALDERGVADARAVGRWIAARKIRVDMVLCSPARRTRETLELIVDMFPRKPEIRYDDELYLADSDRLLDELHALPQDVSRAMLIGHNPGLHDLARSISDATSGPLAHRLADNLPTSGLALFDVATGWAGLRRRGARLKALVTPKDLTQRE